MLGDDALAEDVAQQAFIQAFSDLPRFSRRSSLHTWLFSIALHRCLDASKARRRSENLFAQPGELPDPPGSSESAELRADRSSVQRALDACLSRLAPAARSAVALRYTQASATRRWPCCAARRPARSRPGSRARCRSSNAV